jgi:predicted dehydrogenase
MLAIIGSKGDLGRRVICQLDSREVLLPIDLENRFDLDLYLSEIELALILTPPQTHQYYLEKLVLAGVPSVLCEKPLPVIPNLPHTNSVRIIDHYLFKSHASECKRYYQLQRGNLKSISLSLCESKIEDRPWMWSRSTYGGVVFDLVHHLASLIGYMADDYRSLSAISGVALKRIKFFDVVAPAESLAIIEFDWLGIGVTITVAKTDYEKKGVHFVCLNGEEHFIDLSDQVDYKTIVDSGRSVDKTSLLAYSDAVLVNRFLIRLIGLIAKSY